MIYPPIVASGMVYVGTLGGYVYALDGGTGVERWNALANEGSVPAAVADGTLYTSGAGGVSAFDASTGTRRWVTQSAVSGLTSGDGVIFVAASGSVLSLRA